MEKWKLYPIKRGINNVIRFICRIGIKYGSRREVRGISTSVGRLGKERQPFKLKINDKEIGFPSLETIRNVEFATSKKPGESIISVDVKFIFDFTDVDGLVLEDCIHQLKEVYVAFETIKDGSKDTATPTN